MSAEDSTQSPRPRHRRSPWFVTLIVIGIFIVVAILLQAPLAATSSSSYCGSCKATVPAVEAWAGSVHSRVECVECHIPPGFANRIKWRTRDQRNIWADYLNAPRAGQTGQRPGNNNCMPCHDMSTIGDERTTVRITPSQCAGCHGGKVFCSECHEGLQMPHPKAWEKGHGEVVLERGKSICVSCHLKKDKSFCIDCHGVAMPHPGDWTVRHDNAAARDQKVFVKCHGKNSCVECHGLAMPHPAGFSQSHASTYNSSPGACSKCHSSSYCSDCHGISLPHSASFRENHADAVFSNGGVCVKCHGNAGSGAGGCYGGECHSGSIGD